MYYEDSQIELDLAQTGFGQLSLKTFAKHNFCPLWMSLKYPYYAVLKAPDFGLDVSYNRCTCSQGLIF